MSTVSGLIVLQWFIYLCQIHTELPKTNEFIDGLFASASSEERKFWGFLLFNKVLNEGSPEQTSQVFTKNLVRCLMNQLAVEDRRVHAIMGGT